MKTSGIPHVSPLTTSTGSIAGSEGGSDYKDEGSKYVLYFPLLDLEGGILIMVVKRPLRFQSR
jgi:hypothetical protein